jgi:hypothetical protein
VLAVRWANRHVPAEDSDADLVSKHVIGARDDPEARSLVGRDVVLGQLAGLLDTVGSSTVAFIHGPGGIGKSALLHELGHRAEAAGVSVWFVEGRDQDVAQERLTEGLRAIADRRRWLLLLDTYEQVPVLGGLLREALGTPRAANLSVVIAGRRPPEPAWLELDFGERLLVLRLGPISKDRARELVVHRGLVDAEAIDRVTAWAGGSPLALAVATDALLAGQTLDLDQLDTDAMLATMLLQRIAGDELKGQDREVIAVAAIARAVDARLLAAVLPGVDGDSAEEWLRGLSFAEPLGIRVTLHERVRKAVRGVLVAQDPGFEQELRRRIADHLHARAVMGEPRLSTDLAELVADEVVRWGLAPPPMTHRSANVEPGDAERLAESLGAGDSAWWKGVRRWFDEAPQHIIVVRDVAGAPAGFGIWATPERSPAWVLEDAVLGPWLLDARQRAPKGDVLLIRDTFDLTGVTGGPSPFANVGNHAVVMRSGLANMRYMYGGLAPDDHAGQAFMRALGYVRTPELDVRDGERTICCQVNDMGLAGAMGLIRDIVYRDMGLLPPAALEPDTVGEEAVRDALRCFHQPIALTASPLARGATVEERVASVRRLLRSAVVTCFGDSADERLQRAVIERGYLNPDGGHVRAQRELHLSRAAYFRRLADASTRVGEQVLATLR